ncbi:sensor histidine kinase [Brachybacterium sp. GU-2]|uniref:sensor histidine kinase n=1 Tax=Brachybacterium sp. GU-2 TaxID=3069708 RepID=UPI00280AF252|nr:histidine kinase [Brachybacterium sp. GU-2]WME23267.1 histidine kinase [Brachybacterium sp. GU-2]
MPADVRADASAAPDTAAVGAPRVTGRDLLTAGIYAALVVGLALSGISNSGFLGEGPQWSRGVSVALLLAACASLCWRRSRPLVPFVVAGPLATAEIIGGGQISAYFLLFEALFVPVMHGSRRVARTCTAISIAAAAAAMLAALLGGLPGPAVFLVAMISGLMVSTPLLWGWEVRHHREARGAAERLAGLEHELAESRAAQAVEVERRSIAHDLHDVIAGHLSAVALHSSLAASLEDREAREGSLAASRASAQAALRDLRSMIGVLADEGTGTLPSATLDWPSLAARLRARDPSARVEIAPALTEPARVGPAVQAAALRIGAEAVTNAVRHGRAPIRLTAGIQEGAVRIELVNGRDGAEPLGAGMGRAALAHRALAVGGTASSGPVPDADGSPGWRVEAVLPLDASGDPPAEPPLTGTTLTATETSPR